MSDYVPRKLRSLACKCFQGCKSDLPRFFPIRTRCYTVREPCVCPGEDWKCPTKNEIICVLCKKAHRLDVFHGTTFSTFTCLWCGIQTINTEEEIPAHLLGCSHRPAPTVFMESNMCECEVCPYHCGAMPNSKDTYNQKFTETHREFVISMNLEHQEDKSWIVDMEHL